LCGRKLTIDELVDYGSRLSKDGKVVEKEDYL